MHKMGHWFKTEIDRSNVCELCGLRLPYTNHLDVIGHMLAVAGPCPVKDKEEIIKKLGWDK